MRIRLLIAECYTEYHRSVFLYIYHRIGCLQDAEDLSQDVFLRLLDYEQIICKETLTSFIFTIARNILFSYLRHHQKAQEVSSYIYESSVAYTNNTEEQIIADDLRRCEMRRISQLPPQRRKIYIMSRFECKSAADISVELNISQRTVENHLFIGRKDVRGYMSMCI